MEYKIEKQKGRRCYEVRGTDPRTHKRFHFSTGKQTKLEAKLWVDENLPNLLSAQKDGKKTIAVLMENLLAHYETHKPGRHEKMQQCWDNRMKEKFASIDAREFSFRDIEDYKLWCLGKPVKRTWKPIPEAIKQSTVNRDLATLSRMYSFSYETEQITYTGPKFMRYSELQFKRKGTVTQAEFDRMCDANPPLWLRGMMEVAFYIANRRGELVDLKVRQCDFTAGMIRLAADDCKNQKAKDGPMTPRMRTLLLACCEGKKAEDYVFTRVTFNPEERRYVVGPIGDFRKLWASLLEDAGIERHVLFHDFRRSAVTNMVRNGVPRKTAKAISGHTTDHVFDGYTQVEEQDVQNALSLIMAGTERERQAAEKLDTERQKAKQTNEVTQ